MSEDFLKSPIGKVNLKTYKQSYRKMSYRSNRLRKNCPKYQRIAYDIILKICKSFWISDPKLEQLVFCPSTKRFYSLDIYIPSLRIAIELDGSQHRKNVNYDRKRDDALLNDFKIFVIRFWNRMVISLDFKKTISQIIKEQAGKKRLKPLSRGILCHPNPLSID